MFEKEAASAMARFLGQRARGEGEGEDFWDMGRGKQGGRGRGFSKSGSLASVLRALPKRLFICADKKMMHANGNDSAIVRYNICSSNCFLCALYEKNLSMPSDMDNQNPNFFLSNAFIARFARLNDHCC